MKQMEGQLSFFGTKNVYVPKVTTKPSITSSTKKEEGNEKKEKSGNKITAAELQILFQKSLKMVTDIGIDIGENLDPIIKINYRATSFWGKCHYKRMQGKIIGSWIEVKEELLETTEKDIITTLIHEILHTCDNCQNHGPQWKAYAGRVNQKYGLNIKRATSSEEKGLVKDITNYKYAIRCEKCGKMIYKNRLSNSIKYPNQYHHIKNDEGLNCGGCFERVK